MLRISLFPSFQSLFPCPQDPSKSHPQLPWRNDEGEHRIISINFPESTTFPARMRKDLGKSAPEGLTCCEKGFIPHFETFDRGEF